MTRKFYTDGRFDPSLLLIGLSAFLAAAAIIFLYSYWKYRRCTKEAAAIINSIETVNDARSGRKHRLYISFDTEGGRVNGICLAPADKIQCREGGTIAVMYDPQKPQRYYLKGYALWSIYWCR